MKQALLFLLLLCSTANTYAQSEPDSMLQDAPNLFLDCNFCFENYIRQNVPWLNYVRDRKVADVHVLVTRQNTGAGGREFTFQFIGMERFEGMNDTIVVTIPPNSTTEFVQETQAKTIKMGIMRYVAQTPLAPNVAIDYDVKVEPNVIEDPWNNWVFEVGSSAWFNAEESYQSLNTWSNISADRITPEIKIELAAGMSYNESKFKLSDETIVNIQRSQYFNSRVVKSITNHWSYGVSFDARASIFNNYKLQTQLFPAIEYNLYPYEESTRHQMRIAGHIGYEHRDYNDSTIYDRISDDLMMARMDLAYRVQDTWGSASVSINGNAILTDLSKHELRLWSNLNLRMFKGLNFRISANAAILRNQLNLVKGEASEEDILLRQRQIATNYRYWGNVGITYTFGSIYNTVVNPRFGG